MHVDDRDLPRSDSWKGDMRPACSIGIDFGTSNTVIALARPGETVRAVTFRDDRELSDLYCWVLCIQRLSASRHDIEAQAGSKGSAPTWGLCTRHALSSR